jgi:hypothetical protein
MEDAKISVVIACFNDADYIEQAVCSIKNQTYSNIEIIVVDDGSDAPTKKVLKSIETKIETLLLQENKGVSAARNNGIAASKGDYIMILDSDDYLEPTFLEKAIKYFREDKEVRMVSCYANLIYGKKGKGTLKPKGGNVISFLNNNCALGTSLYKKEDIAAINGYDEKMLLGFEDWDFNIRIMALGGIAKVIKEPLYNYRIKGNSRNEKAKKHKTEILKYIVTKNIDLYKLHIEQTLPKLFFRMEKLEKEHGKLSKSLEYKCGKYLLKPIRFLRTLIKNI